MIKYLLVGMTAYMIFACLFSINFEGDNIGIGFNPEKVRDRVVLDVTSMIE